MCRDINLDKSVNKVNLLLQCSVQDISERDDAISSEFGSFLQKKELEDDNVPHKSFLKSIY